MDQILARDSGGVRVVTLNRPDRMNAFTPTGYRDLRVTLESADSSPDIRVVVIEGGRRAFSAGADLAHLRDDAETQAMKREFVGLLDALTAFSKPLIAAAAGAAVGFGATLLLHCDIVLLENETRLRYPFAALGTAPEAGSSWLLPHIIGTQRAMELILSGRWVTAAEAIEMGLAARSHPYDELSAAAVELARTIAGTPGSAALVAKALLREPMRSHIRDAVARENEAAALLAASVGAPGLTAGR